MVQWAEDGLFPGLYSHGFLANPWLSDGHTLITTSIWRSKDAILSIDILRQFEYFLKKLLFCAKLCAPI